jgi:hypothetical protein
VRNAAATGFERRWRLAVQKPNETLADVEDEIERAMWWAYEVAVQHDIDPGDMHRVFVLASAIRPDWPKYMQELREREHAALRKTVTA